MVFMKKDLVTYKNPTVLKVEIKSVKIEIVDSLLCSIKGMMVSWEDNKLEHVYYS